MTVKVAQGNPVCFRVLSAPFQASVSLSLLYQETLALNAFQGIIAGCVLKPTRGMVMDFWLN